MPWRSLSVDGRFVLVTRYPVASQEGQPRVSVTTYNADSLTWVRESAASLCEATPCPELLSPAPLALTVDASPPSTDPENAKIAYMYLDAPRSRFVSSYLEVVIGATKDEAFVDASDKTQMLTAAHVATTLFELGETAPNEEARRALMRQAAVKLDAIQQHRWLLRRRRRRRRDD
jgi:hypothetical protein